MSHEIWTVPNLLSILRLAGVPLYFILVNDERYLEAVGILFIAGATDYLDGKIARKFNQASKLGELLDPAADRLYIAAILFSLWQLNLLPLALLLALFGRDVILGALLVVMKRRGLPPFKVTYLGKAATFNLLYAFPFLLLTLLETKLVSDTAYVFGWAFSAWGAGLYLYTGVVYFLSGIRQLLVKSERRIEFTKE